MRKHASPRIAFGIACLFLLGLVAFAGSGAPAAGAEEAFPGQGFLPDNRAWEMVTPPEKAGNDEIVVPGRTRAAADGEALQFASSGGFADARGSGTTFDYIAARTLEPGTNGWSTHAITPVVGASSANARGGLGDNYFVGDFSADLDRGVFAAVKPTPGTPEDVAGVANLYRFQGLRTSAAAPWQLATPCPLCAETGEPLPPLPATGGILQEFVPWLAGASPDLEHIAFDSIQNLTGEPAAQTASCGTASQFFPPPGPFFCASRLYEWDKGALRLAGVLPNGEAADASFAGEGAKAATFAYTPRVVSDGSDGHTRIEFTQPMNEEGKTFGELDPTSQLFLMLSGRSGRLYQRIDGAETVALNRSELPACLPEPEPAGCTGAATYLDASADGERVFFMSAGQLTTDAEPNVQQIYMYDFAKPAGEKLTLISPPGVNAAGFIGASEDGRYAYMLAAGSFLVWHDGTIRKVAREPVLETSEDLLNGANWTQGADEARVTPDGRHLVYISNQSPAAGGYDQGICRSGFPCHEVYVYDADTGAVQCASCNPSGAKATVSAATVARGNEGAAIGTTHLNRVISDDGRYVFFDTAEKLLPADADGVEDPYEYDTATGEVHLLSSGRDPSPSWVLESSADGGDAFIATRQRLSGWDVDSNYDIYDARIGGGVPEPAPAPPGCQGDACQPAPAELDDPTPASAGFAGPGNPTPHRHRHRRRRHHARKRHQHRRQASENRRAGR